MKKKLFIIRQSRPNKKRKQQLKIMIKRERQRERENRKRIERQKRYKLNGKDRRKMSNTFKGIYVRNKLDPIKNFNV